MTPGPADTELVRLVREEGRAVLATLVRTTRSWDLAEDAVQDAVVRALETWPTAGVPASPRAWLLLTARRRAIDVLRREARRDDKEVAAARLREPEDPPEDLSAPESVVADDLLRLVFTCCHPTLSLETQVALALRTLCGLSTAEVARALLVPEQTMAKRLTRARQKIALARIPYRVPGAAELPARLRGVLTTVYLVFNEGYDASSGEDPVRLDLAEQALRLARLLHGLLPREPSVTGLLALLLLQHSRRAARVDADGLPVLLADQDRTRWDAAQVREGVELLGAGLRGTPGRPDPYVVQAAIAACHALAADGHATDWAVVVSWYDVLLTVTDTPVVRLNRAVALAERDGAAEGLAVVDALAGLEHYPPWHATRAELLTRLGRCAAAATAYDRALALPLGTGTRRHLEQRRRALGHGASPGSPAPG